MISLRLSQLTAHGPTSSAGSLGSAPPSCTRDPGFAHGPAVMSGVIRLFMNHRQLRPAHSTSKNVFDIPSVTSAIRRKTGAFGRLWPKMPINVESEGGTPGALTNGFGRLSSLVQG